MDQGLIIEDTYTDKVQDAFIQALSLQRHPQREAALMQSQGAPSS
jgi:hypothetical protein